MRAEEDAELNGAEWTDESKRSARLPVDLALEAVAEMGKLPSTGEVQPPAEDL